MTDILNKLIGVFLAFLLMVMGPLTITTLETDLTMRRSTLNEMTNIIDKVTDTGKLTDVELADFYLGCSSHGADVDVTVTRYMRVVNPDGHGGTYVTYMQSDDLTNWNQGDLIRVKVNAVNYSGPQLIVAQMIKLVEPKFEVTLGGMVRH